MTDDKSRVVATRVGPEELKRIEAEEREAAKSSRDKARFARATFDHARDRALADVSSALTQLVRAFPSLSEADGIEPFDALALAAWVKGGKHLGAECAVRFILSVWNDAAARQPEAYGLPYFDLQEALVCWDRHHQQAFAGWVEEPWWP